LQGRLLIASRLGTLGGAGPDPFDGHRFSVRERSSHGRTQSDRQRFVLGWLATDDGDFSRQAPALVVGRTGQSYHGPSPKAFGAG